MKNTKTALITGATSGIGKESALGLARAGYNLIVCGRNQARLDAIVSECHEMGNLIMGVPCDVTDEKAVISLFAQAKEQFPHIDVVFNNAGSFLPAARIDETSLETFKAGIDINLIGAFLVAREAFRTMRDQTPQGGRIINNGSIAAHVPRPNSVPYSTSKHAVTGLTKSISIEGRGLNIACSQIDIGNTATPMSANFSKGVLQANGTTIPEPTFDVRHVVDAIVYMSNLPLDANVQFMTITATQMPYIGRG